MARSLVLDDIADPFWNGIESKFLNESISEKKEANIQSKIKTDAVQSFVASIKRSTVALATVPS